MLYEAGRSRLLHAELVALVGGTVVRAEEHVEIRSDVREVVTATRVARVVPAVQDGITEEEADRPERHAHVRVHERREAGAQDEQRHDRVHADAENERRKVQAELAEESVERMFAMRGDPVDRLRGMVDRVEAPQDRKGVARAMSPVEEDVAREDGECDLREERERVDGACEREGRADRR